jgi:hypothetical protein
VPRVPLPHRPKASPGRLSRKDRSKIERMHRYFVETAREVFGEVPSARLRIFEDE